MLIKPKISAWISGSKIPAYKEPAIYEAGTLQCEVRTKRGQQCDVGHGPCRAYCLNMLQNRWAPILLPHAIALARSESRIDGFDVEQNAWVDVTRRVRNISWWNTPVKGHTLEVMVLAQIGHVNTYYTALITPDNTEHMQMHITPMHPDVDALMQTWGSVQKTPDGSSVRLSLNDTTTIGVTVQAALYLLFHVMSLLLGDPVSFDVRYILPQATLAPHIRGLRFGGL